MSYGDPPIEFKGPGPTIEPSTDRAAVPAGDPMSDDKTLHVATPAGTERRKETGTALPGQRGWGPNNVLPYWDFTKAIQQAVFATWFLGSLACYAFTLGYLFGVFPLRRDPTQREVDALVDQALEQLERDGRLK